MPLAGDEVLGAAVVGGVESVGDLDDGTHPILDDIVPIPVFEDLLLEGREHGEGDAEISPRRARLRLDSEGLQQGLAEPPAGREPLLLPRLQRGVHGAAGREGDAVRSSEGESLDEALPRGH